MMNEMKVFENKNFGAIRIIEIDGNPYFVASDVAKSLGYKDQTNAIKQHCRWVVKHHIPHPQSKTKTLEVNVIPEGDLYRLISHSELPNAEMFESWLYDEVLPTLRKTGSYEMPKKDKKQDEPKKKNLSATNMLVKTVSGIFKEAGVDPLYIAAEAKRLYKEQAGIEIDIPLITDETTQQLWDCTGMAKKLGIMSESGRPHDKAVSAIIQNLDIFTDEVVRTAYTRNGHDGVTVQYKDSVLQKAKEWLEENGYPTVIELALNNGNINKCKVVYREVA